MNSKKGRTVTAVLVTAFKILRLLKDRHFGVTMKEMLEETKLGRRSLYRYLHSFGSAGLVVEPEYVPQIRAKRWRLRNRVVAPF
jgi:DNA-binding IclR family transcriptional regulator